MADCYEDTSWIDAYYSDGMGPTPAQVEMQKEADRRNARELEVEESHNTEFERLLGAVAWYEDMCEEYVNGTRTWADLKRQRSTVELCAMRLRGGI